MTDRAGTPTGTVPPRDATEGSLGIYHPPKQTSSVPQLSLIQIRSRVVPFRASTGCGSVSPRCLHFGAQSGRQRRTRGGDVELRDCFLNDHPCPPGTEAPSLDSGGQETEVERNGRGAPRRTAGLTTGYTSSGGKSLKWPFDRIRRCTSSFCSTRGIRDSKCWMRYSIRSFSLVSSSSSCFWSPSRAAFRART